MTEILALLILLTVIAAIITVMTSNLLYAVISVGAVGFLLKPFQDESLLELIKAGIDRS